MSIFIAGGTGFIGRRLVRLLASHGECVVCMSRRDAGEIFADLGKQVTVSCGDITQFDDVMAAMAAAKPRRVVNLSFLFGDGNAPHVAVKRNIVGMDNFFEAARLMEVPRVVYASTLGVNGLQKCYGERLVSEDEPLHGTGQYAKHKIFNEWQAEQYADRYGMSITGIRPANVTGPDKIRGSIDHVRCITEPARGRPVQFEHKDFMRLVVHVDDVAEIFRQILMADAPKHRLYNIGGHAVSLGELADIVCESIPDANISFASETGGRDRSGCYLVDNNRLTQEFAIDFTPLRLTVQKIIIDIRRAARHVDMPVKISTGSGHRTRPPTDHFVEPGTASGRRWRALPIG